MSYRTRASSDRIFVNGHSFLLYAVPSRLCAVRFQASRFPYISYFFSILWLLFQVVCRQENRIVIRKDWKISRSFRFYSPTPAFFPPEFAGSGFVSSAAASRSRHLLRTECRQRRLCCCSPAVVGGTRRCRYEETLKDRTSAHLRLVVNTLFVTRNVNVHKRLHLSSRLGISCPKWKLCFRVGIIVTERV